MSKKYEIISRLPIDVVRFGLRYHPAVETTSGLFPERSNSQTVRYTSEMSNEHLEETTIRLPIGVAAYQPKSLPV